MDGFILTRFEHLETLGLVRKDDLSKSVQRTREALDAKDPELQTPDHPIRLKAAEQFFKLADLYPKRDVDPSDPTRPIAVNIFLANRPDTRPVSNDYGVRVHLRGRNGGGAGDRTARDAGRRQELGRGDGDGASR